MRLLHTMLRVGDLERSLKFYTEVLGMTVLRRKDYPDGKFTLAFIGYGDEASNTAIELTYNWDTSSYDLGNAFGHIAIEVEDVYKACEEIKAKGGKVTREAGPMKHGSSVLAFIEDPDGYKIELLSPKRDKKPEESQPEYIEILDEETEKRLAESLEDYKAGRYETIDMSVPGELDRWIKGLK